MPLVTFHKNGQVYRDEVQPRTNLVVRAGIKQFPFPHLAYQCGMGKCASCACRVLAGAEHLPEPNWKEKKQLQYSPQNNNAGASPMAALIGAIVSAALTRAAPNYMPLTRQANQQVFFLSPNAIPNGPYRKTAK